MSLSSSYFCRDCLVSNQLDKAKRCQNCGSPRLVYLKGSSDLTLAHIDCDAFFASIEKRDNPELINKPLIIGGGKRGVVSTACYIARTKGVRSAMPMFQALKLCPDAIVVSPNLDKYRSVSKEIRRLMFELTPQVEAISIDEAFLDLSGTERLHHGSPALTLARLAKKIEQELNLTVSIGLSYNKFLAKIASDLEKPRGFSIISREEAVSFLSEKPVRIISGIGPSAQAKLEKAGITLIRHIRGVPYETLLKAAGNDAKRLLNISKGEDNRPVVSEHETKSISNETTFERDIFDFDELEVILWRLSEKLSLRMKKAGYATTSITLKLKDNKFQTISRVRSKVPATKLANRIFDIARQLLRKECDGHRAFRLLGIGASELCDISLADRGDLADTNVVKTAKMEDAIDLLREKYGFNALKKGISLR